MTQIPKREQGFRRGIRAAVTWLHREAARMNDPRAVRIINRCADHLGKEFSPRLRPRPDPAEEARAWLIRHGFTTPDGQLAPQYRHEGEEG